MKEKLHRGNYLSNIQFLKNNHLLDKKEIKILEIGSGTGALVNYLRHHGFNIVGTEYSEKMISISKSYFGNLDIKRMSGENLKFNDSSFDLVISFDVFEHIPDTDSHLEEVKRVLKPNGIYAFGTPNKITNIPWKIIDKKSLFGWREYHCSLHTYNGLKKRLKKHNFDYRYVNIDITNKYFLEKIRKRLGKLGVYMIKLVRLDKLPYFIRPNFYVIAQA